MTTTALITKSDGSTQPFDRTKLERSLVKVGAASDVAGRIADEVERGIGKGTTTSEIYSRAFASLRQHSHKTAIRYSLRRALFELGPDGFPFEKFVARIFKLWGYEDAITDQTVMGRCVEHEVDVVAWKGDELSMVEAKFHNELGLRSDLKVALYVKARYDDLAETDFDYGGKRRKLSPNGRWLFTNTKFTETAVKYGECNGLKMVGWNHPANGGLHQIMEQNGLHPITALTTLGRDEKREIIGLGILTCIDLIGAPETLDKAGIKDARKEQVLTEAQMVVEQEK